jgi:DNA-binding NarL/FixJ family response regulator
MAKLTKELRSRAINELKAGASPVAVALKYTITPSAVSYLKLKATGETPQLLELEERIGYYARERILRLFHMGYTPKEIAEDYECPTATMKTYLEKHRNVRSKISNNVRRPIP